jgi:hypothetical protein
MSGTHAYLASVSGLGQIDQTRLRTPILLVNIFAGH